MEARKRCLMERTRIVVKRFFFNRVYFRAPLWIAPRTPLDPGQLGTLLDWLSIFQQKVLQVYGNKTAF